MLPRPGARSLWIVGALLVVAACGGDQRPRPQAGNSTDAGGTLRIPLINDPILDPVVAPDIGSVMVNKVLFPGLVRPDEALRPIPDLALSWTTSDDGLRTTFKLRPGVTWHDGTPFTAADVKFTFDQILDLKSGSRLRSDFAAVDGVDVDDSLTVTFRPQAPFAPFLTLLGYNAGILPKHLLQGAPLADATDFNRKHPVGTGPFMVQDVSPGASITLVRNPRYYGTPPRLDRIVFRWSPTSTRRSPSCGRANSTSSRSNRPTWPACRGSPASRCSRCRWSSTTTWGSTWRAHTFARPRCGVPWPWRSTARRSSRACCAATATRPSGRSPSPCATSWPTHSSPSPTTPTRHSPCLQLPGGGAAPTGCCAMRLGPPSVSSCSWTRGTPRASRPPSPSSRTCASSASMRRCAPWSLPRSCATASFPATSTPSSPGGPPRRTPISTPSTTRGRTTTTCTGPTRWPTRCSPSDAPRATPRRQAIYRAFQALELEDPPVIVLFFPREIQAVSSRLQGLPLLGIRDALRHSERFAMRAP
ncbi:MAG: hypothetical protein IPF47_21245 [Gemmatimonadetes bacterium]|nr:hypothetical protein [Gemmatimonadota bacterium]